MVFPAVSVTTVVRFCVTPLVTVPLVLPFKVTEMVFGGQVEKYPADDPEPATDAVIAVVPGNAAVIWLVSLLMLATELVPTAKVSTPIALLQLGSDVTPGSTPPEHAYVVTDDGAHSSYCTPFFT